ncbi:actin-like ATPase domain-containing protein [Mytilinidion resinicola]|uniref:Actin-like ATPase domain-containing protein n=1 Tax=Mytilinidion resinicola TaxID=574789 RepID=A0A6A6YZH9_9PEZI|nr:actin-like ATPase domain-containing protein [Mytilinidion resinicola]KAF2814241.1 actin-like ATPase domain-containing protein [Mytilinidion resinicola]
MFTAGLASRPKLIDDASSFHDDDDFMVIGIDFGTTYSGAAWATGEDFASDQINLVTSWPGTGLEEGKVPTELFYEHNEIMWGYEIPLDADPVRWFKLLLLKDEDLDEEMRYNEFILRGRKMLKENGKTAIDFISDFLHAIWIHVLETVKKAHGETVIDALAFHVVITVPAIWKGYARQGMEEAAKKAGILDRRAAGATTLTFAPEPEAAALSTLCEPGRKAKTGEVYMICDAGGGTVDLISYKIGGVNPMKLDEAAEGTGGLCGGIFIDETFERMCKARLGRKWDHLSKAGIKEIMKGEWEHAIKPQFMPGNRTKEYIVRIPAEAFGKSSLDDTSRQPFIKNGRIHFSSPHIQWVFTETFSGIDALVDEQLRKAAKQGLKLSGIILVGGLGASPYLYEHLKKKHAKDGIDILQSVGMRPRTAICRGAVIKGFIDGCSAVDTSGLDSMTISPIQVTSTVSRFSLGMKIGIPFDENKHLQKDKEWSIVEEKWMEYNQMQWFLKKGEITSKKDPIRFSFYEAYERDPEGFSRLQLYQCKDEVPPSRRTSSVTELCQVSRSIDVPFSAFTTVINSCGESIKKISWEVEVVPSGAAVEFAFYIDGRKQQAQNALVHFQ